jgi:hypothetical protein
MTRRRKQRGINIFYLDPGSVSGMTRRRKQRGINIFYLDPGSVSGMTRRRKRRGIKPMLRNKFRIATMVPPIPSISSSLAITL